MSRGSSNEELFVNYNWGVQGVTHCHVSCSGDDIMENRLKWVSLRKTHTKKFILLQQICTADISDRVKLWMICPVCHVGLFKWYFTVERTRPVCR